MGTVLFKEVDVLEFHVRQVVKVEGFAYRTKLHLSSDDSVCLNSLPLKTKLRHLVREDECLIFTSEKVVEGNRVILSAAVVDGKVADSMVPDRMIGLPTFHVQLSRRKLAADVEDGKVKIIDSRS
jgi:hypothetical protein